MADLDGSPAEVLTANVFDATSTLPETITITAGDLDTGDGIATLAQFSTSDISSLTIRVADENDASGWGVDNLSYTPVPIPGAVWLLGSGLIGLVGFRRKFRK